MAKILTSIIAMALFAVSSWHTDDALLHTQGSTKTFTNGQSYPEGELRFVVPEIFVKQACEVLETPSSLSDFEIVFVGHEASSGYITLDGAFSASKEHDFDFALRDVEYSRGEKSTLATGNVVFGDTKKFTHRFVVSVQKIGESGAKENRHDRLEGHICWPALLDARDEQSDKRRVAEPN